MSIEKKKEYVVYATEADLLNMALFGCRAKDWEEHNPELAAKGMNLRDTGSINQLIVLSNMEVVNAELIKRGVERAERFAFLQQMALDELQSLNKTNVEQQFKRLATKYPPQQFRKGLLLLLYTCVKKKRTNKEPTGDVQDANEVEGW